MTYADMYQLLAWSVVAFDAVAAAVAEAAQRGCGGRALIQPLTFFLSS